MEKKLYPIKKKKSKLEEEFLLLILKNEFLIITPARTRIKVVTNIIIRYVNIFFLDLKVN
jgi:hypothetical protein